MMAHRDHLFGYFFLYLFIFRMGEHLQNEGSDLPSFVGSKASGRDSWCAQSDAAANLRWSGVGGNGIPVYQDTRVFKGFLSGYTGYSGLGEVNEDEMVIGAARYQS